MGIPAVVPRYLSQALSHRGERRREGAGRVGGQDGGRSRSRRGRRRRRRRRARRRRTSRMGGKRKAGTMEGKGREGRGALVGGGRDHSMPPQADELGSNKNQKNNNKKYQNGSGQHTLGGPKCPPKPPSGSDQRVL